MSSYQKLTPGIVTTSQNAGSQDAQTASQGIYIVSDMIGEMPLFSNNAGGGASYYGPVTTPGGNPTLPAGWTAASLAAHPGCLCVQTAAANDCGHGHVGTTVNPYESFFVANTGPVWTFNHIFAVPATLSTAADRYFLYVGNITGTGSQVFGGFFLQYSDGTNGGNWQVMENTDANGTVVIANSSVAPVAGSWNKLTFIINGTNVTCTLNGVQLCNTTSPTLSAGGIILCSIGGIRMFRSTSSASAIIYAYLDRSSISAPLSR